MNYLAHAYLSFGQPQILAGNMISDFVKGKKQYEFTAMIRKGIRLHREIDNFTDTHSIIREMKKPFKDKYGLYAGTFVDIVCDYFLANDKNEFTSDEALLSFSTQTYTALEKQLPALPATFQHIFVYMKQQDWLFNYRLESAIEKSFTGLVRRAKYMDDARTAFAIFQKNLENLRPHYMEFFPLLKKYALLNLEKFVNSD